MKRKFIIAFSMIFQASVAFGDVYIYPNKGQSAQQQDRDRYECHSWAVQQTGFDPTRPAQAPAQSSPQPGGEVVKGAARGALVGTVGGATAGDAGRGAAAGTAVISEETGNLVATVADEGTAFIIFGACTSL